MIKSDAYLNSTIVPANINKVEFDENAGFLKIHHAGHTETIDLLANDEFSTVDKDCDKSVKSLYKYMDAMGRSKCVMFGQENNLQCKAGDRKYSHSDTYDLVGDYPALLAFDVLSFTGVEFNATRYNQFYTEDIPGWKALPHLETEGVDPRLSDIYAAAAFAKRHIELGGVFSLSAHMPNFLFSKVREDYTEGTTPAIAKYNYKEYTPNRCEGKVVKEVMPGGKANDAFTRYLDIIAIFAKAVEKPFFFRPLHENTGSWFWWGKDHCSPSQFKDLWRYIVEYLRDKKDVHNLLYAYSPGSENADASEYEERYPGDDMVDLIGVDMYDPDTEKGDGSFFLKKFRHQLSILDEVSAKHNKLMAVTETGLASNNPDEDCHATAIHLTGNINKKWHSDILDCVSDSNASYFLLWANFSKYGTYYTPYIDHRNEDGSLFGHEMCDDFIEYYNDERSIFASHQKDAVSLFS
ncbi:MAG: glycoside hydrolase family 26 protein [Lachnospiraceae bacterium]|nr:glycoside hydrolase family 26 protein [Lachnospiraceae bacterium]